MAQWRKLGDKDKCWYDDLSDEIWRECVRLHELPVSDYPANVRPERAARKSAKAAARALGAFALIQASKESSAKTVAEVPVKTAPKKGDSHHVS